MPAVQGSWGVVAAPACLARPRRLLLFCAVVIAALVLPGVARAHVGSRAPVATNFEARITGVEPASGAVEAKVVDGDRALWLRTAPNTAVIVPGVEDEPLLRFDRGGVFVNLGSLTAQSDGIDRLDLHPNVNPNAPPLWHRLSSGHSYRWHEHRLHALEPLARGDHATTVVGRWRVPLVIDGRRHSLVGTLVFQPPGSGWPWILLACSLGAVVAGTLTLSTRAARRTAVVAAVVATVLVWTVRIGRELYGRPGVPLTGYVEIALTSLVGVVLLYGLLHWDREVHMFTALIVSFGCLYQGLTMLPVLTHAIALTVLPTFVARAGIAAILGLGVGVLAIALRDQLAADPSHGDREAQFWPTMGRRHVRRPRET
jgi:hypothetical protein